MLANPYKIRETYKLTKFPCYTRIYESNKKNIISHRGHYSEKCKFRKFAIYYKGKTRKINVRLFNKM